MSMLDCDGVEARSGDLMTNRTLGTRSIRSRTDTVDNIRRQKPGLKGDKGG